MNWIDARIQRPTETDGDELLILTADGYCGIVFYSETLGYLKRWTFAGVEIRYWMPLYEVIRGLEGVVPGKWRHEEPRFADWDDEEEEENDECI